ncbi:MAG: hypothetical protein M0P71_07640 [Melioribacteraceae bacterium]|nr:hypothetical protein [Melioribacteraceae bacterium]
MSEQSLNSYKGAEIMNYFLGDDIPEQIINDANEMIEAGTTIITATVTPDEKGIDKFNNIVGYLFTVPRLLIQGYVQLGDKLHQSYDVPRWLFLVGTIYGALKLLKRK